MADSLCGPSNAAKGLTRHLDQDRSLQRDRLAGPSGIQDATQDFRSLRLDNNTANQQFAAFQNSSAPLVGPLDHVPRHFDHPTPLPFQYGNHPLRDAHKGWATEFNQRSLNAPINSPGPLPNLQAASLPYSRNQIHQSYQMNPFPSTATYMPMPVQQPTGLQLAPNYPQVQHTAPSDFDFDKELRAWYAMNGPEVEAQVDTWLDSSNTVAQDLATAQQTSTASAEPHQLMEQNLSHLHQDQAPAPALSQDALRNEPQAQQQSAEDTELARAAQQIVDSVGTNENVKFRESSFLKMMRKIASQDMVVRGNNLVESQPDIAGAGAASETAAGDGDCGLAAGLGRGRSGPKAATVEDVVSP